jgi:molybdopterin-guanine dinucleotide biosynthesis protein A
MGRDKATLVIDGEALWARQLGILRELMPQNIFISARSAPPWSPPDTQLVLDVPPSRGPLSGIAVGLELMNTTHLLVLAVDLPNMSSAHLGKLLSQAAPGRGIVPRHADYFEPLAAVYPKQSASVAQCALANQNLALQPFARDLLQRGLLKEYPLSSEDASQYSNLNTLSDLPRSS